MLLRALRGGSRVFGADNWIYKLNHPTWSRAWWGEVFWGWPYRVVDHWVQRLGYGWSVYDLWDGKP